MGPVVYRCVDDALQYYGGRLPVRYIPCDQLWVGIAFSLIAYCRCGDGMDSCNAARATSEKKQETSHHCL